MCSTNQAELLSTCSVPSTATANSSSSSVNFNFQCGPENREVRWPRHSLATHSATRPILLLAADFSDESVSASKPATMLPECFWEQLHVWKDEQIWPNTSSYQSQSCLVHFRCPKICFLGLFRSLPPQMDNCCNCRMSEHFQKDSMNVKVWDFFSIAQPIKLSSQTILL